MLVKCSSMLRWKRFTMTKAIWRVSILLAAIGIHGAVPAEPFVCMQDVCNRNGNDQFCSEAYGHCRDCKDILDVCGKYTQPINCTRFCIGYLVDVKVKSLQKTECPILENVPNGSHSGSVRHRYGDVVNITCNDGFQITSTGTITCREFGRWSHDLPSCKEIECPVLGEVENGKHNGSNIHLHVYGDVVGITCNDGFEPTSAGSTICTEFGRWSHGLPSCKDAGVSWNILFYVTVSILLVVILVLAMVCFFLCKKNKNETLVNENVSKGDPTERHSPYYVNVDVNDETLQKFIDVDDQTLSTTDDQSFIIDMENDFNQGADPIPPRPRYTDCTQVVPSNPALLDNQAEQHDGTVSAAEVPNGPGLKLSIKGNVSIVSLDTTETEDDGGEVSSDSGVTDMKKMKTEDKQGIAIHYHFTTNVKGDGNVTTTGNQNNVEAPNRIKQKRRRRPSNSDKGPKTHENEADNVTIMPAQETGETKFAIQPESSSSDENSPDCARKSRIDLEKAGELRPETNIVCTPNDVSEKAHNVAVGLQDIPMNELNKTIVTGQE